MAKARLIALYLPQFHPIPENDKWWGKGFTEWTNVGKAKPLFIGHQQPNHPADLGFYDLRLPESRQAQADLARAHGIEGFCYWHYWFGGGRRLLERPLNEVLKSGEPDFPFCLAWANHTWSGVWHGCPDRILIEQTYPGVEDYTAHFYAMLDAFRDPRYMKVNGKCIFGIYKPKDLKEPRLFMDTWRELAVKEGLGGFHFIAMVDFPWDALDDGYDAYTTNPPVAMVTKQDAPLLNEELEREALKWRLASKEKQKLPQVYSYESFITRAFPDKIRRQDFYPCVVPNWDNTPRSGVNGFALHQSTPELYERHLREAIDLVADRQAEERVVFLKSWNEWAETNYLEPDLRWGTAYLEATLRVAGSAKTVPEPPPAPHIETSEKKFFCLHPFFNMEFSLGGRVYTCCPAHVKNAIGNIAEQSVAEIWNGEAAQFMRGEILAGRWENICKPSCPVIQDHLLKGKSLAVETLTEEKKISDATAQEIKAGKTVLDAPPSSLHFANTVNCNLNCIMCSCKKAPAEDALLDKSIQESFVYLPHLKRIVLTGSGDPLACPKIRKMLANFDGQRYPDVKIVLLTNGLLLPRFWEEIKHHRFATIDISVDAATAATYEKIRRPGRWDDLIQALDFLATVRDRFSWISINMTVMKENYREIPAFIALGAKYRFAVRFNEVRTSGDLTDDSNIFTTPGSPEFQDFIDIVSDAQSQKHDIDVNWGNLTTYASPKKVHFINVRTMHHSGHSGYDRLMDFIRHEPLPAAKRCHEVTQERREDLFKEAKHDISWYNPPDLDSEMSVNELSPSSSRHICHYLYGENSLYHTQKSQSAKKKIFVTFHQPPEAHQQFIRTRAPLANVDGIVVVGTNQIPFFEQYVDRSKIHFVPHGVDTNFFRPDESVAKTPHSVLFVGNWLRDFDTLVAVAAILAEKAPHVTIDVVTLEKNRALFDGCGNITFSSGIPEEELLRKYQQASLLLVPMKDCTANNSVLEGMACGLPVVTTDIGGIRDYVDEECAILTRPGDAAQTAEAVLTLLNDAGRRARMGRSSRERAQRFSWETVAITLEAAYRGSFSA